MISMGQGSLVSSVTNVRVDVDSEDNGRDPGLHHTSTRVSTHACVSVGVRKTVEGRDIVPRMKVRVCVLIGIWDGVD